MDGYPVEPPRPFPTDPRPFGSCLLLPDPPPLSQRLCRVSAPLVRVDLSSVYGAAPDPIINVGELIVTQSVPSPWSVQSRAVDVSGHASASNLVGRISRADREPIASRDGAAPCRPIRECALRRGTEVGVAPSSHPVPRSSAASPTSSGLFQQAVCSRQPAPTPVRCQATNTRSCDRPASPPRCGRSLRHRPVGRA